MSFSCLAVPRHRDPVPVPAGPPAAPTATGSRTPDIPPATGRRRWRLRHGVLPLVVAASATGLAAAVPSLSGTSWAAVLVLLRTVRPTWLGAAAAVWFLGLLGYTWVLRASLPGLTTRQALSLNLAGSAVANTVPAGGAVSIGLTTAMARSWGFTPTALGAYFTVSNAWTAAGRVGAGLAGLSAVVLLRPGTVHLNGLGTLFGVVALAVVLVVGVLGRERSTRAAAGMVGRAVDRIDRRRGRPARGAEDRLGSGAVAARRLSLDLSRRSWYRFVAGMVCYLTMLGILLAVCLHAVGQSAPLVVVFAAVGIERLSGAVPFTPGGVGVADLALVTVLTAAGAAPAAAAAATLLYRLFTFGAEIPVGGAVALGWALLRRRRAAAGPVGVGEVAP